MQPVWHHIELMMQYLSYFFLKTLNLHVNVGVSMPMSADQHAHFKQNFEDANGHEFKWK